MANITATIDNSQLLSQALSAIPATPTPTSTDLEINVNHLPLMNVPFELAPPSRPCSPTSIERVGKKIKERAAKNDRCYQLGVLPPSYGFGHDILDMCLSKHLTCLGTPPSDGSDYEDVAFRDFPLAANDEEWEAQCRTMKRKRSGNSNSNSNSKEMHGSDKPPAKASRARISGRSSKKVASDDKTTKTLQHTTSSTSVQSDGTITSVMRSEKPARASHAKLATSTPKGHGKGRTRSQQTVTDVLPDLALSSIPLMPPSSPFTITCSPIATAMDDHTNVFTSPPRVAEMRIEDLLVDHDFSGATETLREPKEPYATSSQSSGLGFETDSQLATHLDSDVRAYEKLLREDLMEQEFQAHTDNDSFGTT